MSRCTVTCHDARSHVTMHGHMSRCTVTCHDARSHVTMQVTCHDARSHERKIHITFEFSDGALRTFLQAQSFHCECQPNLYVAVVFVPLKTRS